VFLGLAPPVQSSFVDNSSQESKQGLEKFFPFSLSSPSHKKMSWLRQINTFVEFEKS
jgi:hypothetical protein